MFFGLTDTKTRVNKMAYFGITLCSPVYPANMGSIARLCINYNASFINVIDGKFCPNATNIFRTERHLPISEMTEEHFLSPNSQTVGIQNIAVEIDPLAKSAEKMIHPRAANYIFGSESSSIPQSIIKHCDKVVKIATVDCLNLAFAVHTIMMYRHFQKNSSKFNLLNGGNNNGT